MVKANPQLALNQRLRVAEHHLARADSKMASLIQRHGPCQIQPSSRPPFEYLIRSIISQQLSSKAASTIVSRVESLLGQQGFSAEAILAVSYDQLRACGLSNAKVQYSQGIAQACLDDVLDFNALADMPSEEVIETLIQLKGVGEWTAQMFCIFALGHLDVFAPADIGLQRGLQHLYELEEKPAKPLMQELTEPWRPYRSVASWYLWRIADDI